MIPRKTEQATVSVDWLEEWYLNFNGLLLSRDTSTSVALRLALNFLLDIK